MGFLEVALTSDSVSPVIFTALGLMVGVLAYLYTPYWSVRKVPGPPAIPLVGDLPLMAKHGPNVFSVLARQYGPIFRFHMGRQPLIIVADAELCREVGIRKFKDIPNRSIPSPIAAFPLHQKGLFFTRDSRWSTMRNTILSVYQPSHLASLVPTMQSYIDSASKTLDSLSASDDVIFSEFSLGLVSDVIGQAAFGVNFHISGHAPPRGEISTVTEFIDKHTYSTTQLKMDLTGSLSIVVGLVAPILQEPFRQILKRIPGTMDWKLHRTTLALSGQLDEIVANRAAEKDRGSKDFLSCILNARDSGSVSGDIFSPDYVSAATYEHLLAGSATTAFTMSAVVYLVAGHPEVETKLVAEIDAFGDRKPTAPDLHSEFPYLDQVVKEAMRFYLVSPLIARETSNKVEIGGYTLPKGTWIWLAPGVLAKDSKNFPEPEKFKPERFDPNGEEEKRRHPYAFIPFGVGPRSCIGQKFSIQEIKLSLIHLYRKFLFRHSPNMESPLQFDFGIVLSYKHGVKLRVLKRSQQPL